MSLTIKQLCQQSLALSKMKGWYGPKGNKKRNVPEMLMLIVSELAEALGPSRLAFLLNWQMYSFVWPTSVRISRSTLRRLSKTSMSTTRPVLTSTVERSAR
jgi:hypothetical protein